MHKQNIKIIVDGLTIEVRREHRTVNVKQDATAWVRDIVTVGGKERMCCTQCWTYHGVVDGLEFNFDPMDQLNPEGDPLRELVESIEAMIDCVFDTANYLDDRPEDPMGSLADYE